MISCLLYTSIRPVSFSFGKQSFSEPSFQELDIVQLTSPALLAYLQERGLFVTFVVWGSEELCIFAEYNDLYNK